MNTLIHTPDGVRDIFGRECDKKRYLERRIDKLYRSFGYQSIETPSFEFFDVFAREVGTVPSKDLYKFFDREGHTLVLRPDITPAVARAVSMYFAEETMPLRLCYRGNVYINHSGLMGRLKESTQMGAEFLNEDSAEADAEILALVIRTMLLSGLQDFQVSIGHVDFFRALTDEAALSDEAVGELRDLLEMQNRFGALELIDSLHLRADLQNAFSHLPELFGDEHVLEKAKELTGNRRALNSIARLQKIYGLLKEYGLEKYVTFDLGMMTAYHYYTGIIFQAYTYGSGDALIKGGRYNRLMSHFGKDAAAVGFAVEMDALLQALERQHVALPIADIKTMVLYAPELEKQAIHFAAREREKQLDVACIRFARDKMLDDYKAYGSRNQFGGIIYFCSITEVYAINLLNGETEKLPADLLVAKTDGSKEGQR